MAKCYEEWLHRWQFGSSVLEQLSRIQLEIATLAEQVTEFRGAYEPTLLLPIEELGLPAGLTSALKSEMIDYVGCLVIRTREEVLKIPNRGRHTLPIIENALAERGLALGMRLSGWPPSELERRQD